VGGLNITGRLSRKKKRRGRGKEEKDDGSLSSCTVTKILLLRPTLLEAEKEERGKEEKRL
jgi:hypothetical protein